MHPAKPISTEPGTLVPDDTDAATRAKERARRLEDLGCFARGYAHELNNRLAVILGGISHIEAHLAGAAGACADDLATIRQAAAEAGDFVRQIEVFTLGSEPIRRPLDVAAWLRGVWPTLPKRADVVYGFSCDDALPVLPVDHEQLERALANLLRNANAAITGSHGKVDLKVSVTSRDARPVMDFSFSDNGAGVDATMLPHLAEPYFSTRHGENATGLGLTVCDAMVRAHGGSMAIRSMVGVGTTVTLSFPLATADGAPPLAEGALSSHSDAMAFPCKVLVLEDEPMVRRALAIALERAGCEVIETATGEEAIAAWQQATAADKPVVVVVSDLTIRGGMGGAETIKRLHELAPGLRAVACSGYSDDPVMSYPERYGFFSALPKPFEPADLVAAVAAAASTRFA